MLYSEPLNILIVLAFLSLAQGIDLSGDWKLTKLTAETLSLGFAEAQSGNSPYIAPDIYVNIDAYVSCSSISLAGGQAWSLTADATSILSSTSEYAFGFWVNFESTISNKVFQFGSFGAHYFVSSTTDGTLKVSFISATNMLDPVNDFSFTVPLNKWLFIMFHFTDNSGTVTLEVILPGTAPISKTSVSAFVAFTMPGGQFYFGMSVKGKFYRVVLTKTAIINASYDTVTLEDYSSNQEVQATPCTAGTCIDDICLQGMGKICLSSMQYCTACDGSGCTTCDPDSARDKGAYCQNCIDDGTTNELKNYHCCAIANKCVECSKKSTQCDICAAGYFLNDDSATSTSCLSCDSSCTTCLPGPNCYTCATTITQTGTNCRVDSFGFEVSVDLPNIVLDFAHPLKTGLSISSFTAASASGSNIPTATWTLVGCTAGLKQCKVGAPNVLESDLPITLNLEFTQA
ncbi:unnamed protein product [Blepharisma stoltei]|uniref:TNFR-Cys domain-containing protein n=1 Tax=Blepharisma stoltei TaxID=1481888 RepID=A0AAU9KCT4_9CILI|nr:unnamed protein product [Blepharisma stoltei]